MSDESDLTLPEPRFDNGLAEVERYLHRAKRAIDILKSRSLSSPAASPAGTVTLAGDVTGSSGATVVGAIDGTALTGLSPAAGDVLTATGTGTTMAWQAPAATGGWETLYECDFTAETTQAFVGDGVKTLSSGATVAAFGTANCSSSGVVAGTGLQCTVNVATVGIQAGFSLGVASVPDMATYPGGEEWEYTAVFSASAQASNGEQAMMFAGESGVADRSTVGFRLNGATPNIFFQYCDPGGAQVIGSTTATNMTDVVFQTRIKNASYLEAWSGPYTGGAGGTWRKTMRLRGSRTHAVQTAQWIAGVQSFGVSVYGFGGVSVNGRTLTLKYFRIRRKAVA